MKGAEGSMAVVIAVGLVVLLGMASLAVDLGHLYTVKNEMQNTVDAAALAAARALIHEDTANRGSYRDAPGAVNAAMSVIQQASGLQGLNPVDSGSRNDVTITFGTWNEHGTGSKWTDIGNSSAVPSSSTANAVQVTLRRAAGTAYGPVTNFFAGVFGSGTSEVSATSRAYMGYTYSVYAGTVELPIALPATILQMASKGKPSWLAQVLSPREAEATATKTYVFKDTGGNNTDTALNNAPLDASQAYFFTVGKNDPVPNTLTDILDKIANPNFHSNGNIYHVAGLKLGDQVYAVSEFKYPDSLVTLFQKLQAAYNAKKDSNGTWRITMPVMSGVQNPLKHSQRPGDGFRSLARLLSPWPSEAYACYTLATPPIMYVNGFVNVDVTNVSVNASCDQCNYTFPKTIGSVTYANKKDCMSRLPNSAWNSNSMTLKNVTDVSSIIPGIPNVAGEAGGLSAKEMNSAAPTNVGAFASVPKLIPAN
jgi:Flp pilus assembly protein TadG